MDKVLCRPAPGTSLGRPAANLSNQWRNTSFGGLFHPRRLRVRIRLCRAEDLHNRRPDTQHSNRLPARSRNPFPWDLICLLVAL
jgi:hypothetical protein